MKRQIRDENYLRRLFAALTPTEEEILRAKIEAEQYNAQWQSFFWGMGIAFIISIVMAYIKECKI